MNSDDLEHLREVLRRRNERVNSTWITTKIIFFTVLTVIGLLASLLLLPIFIIVIGGIIAFGVYKVRFTDPDR